MLKSLKCELYTLIHPRAVQKVRMDGTAISEKSLRSAYIFLISYFLVFGLSILIISLQGFDFETNVSAVAATLNNIGPGFAGVGPTSNFSAYSWWAKLVMIFDMWAGRLELLPILILFYPRTWKRHG